MPLQWEDVGAVLLHAAHWTENEKKRSFIFFSLFDLKMGHSADNFFFQEEIKFFYLTTLIQLPMAHIKITFSIFFFDWVA
jgi:hypothetical protein